MCGDFESGRKRQYRKFKTKVKRRDIDRILRHLIAGHPVSGQYADWITEYAAVLAAADNRKQWGKYDEKK